MGSMEGLDRGSAGALSVERGSRSEALSVGRGSRSGADSVDRGSRSGGSRRFTFGSSVNAGRLVRGGVVDGTLGLALGPTSSSSNPEDGSPELARVGFLP